MIECKDVDYILAIAKHQSISLAARELFISQPALTKYLQSVESRVGIVLFDRSKKKLLPTLAGERYIAYAAEMAGVKSQLEREMTRVKSERSETLKVAFSCTGLRDIVYEAIMRLRKLEPTLQMDFREMTSPEIERLVQDYQLDIGFISLPTNAPDVQAEVFFEENILLCVPVTNPLSALGKQVKGSPYPWINLELFKDEPFILRNTGTRFRMLTDRLFEQCGITSPVTIMTSRDQFTSVEFGESWSVTFFLPESFVKNIHKPDTFRFFLTGSPLPKLSVGAIHRRGDLMSVPAHRLLHVMNGIMAEKQPSSNGKGKHLSPHSIWE